MHSMFITDDMWKWIKSPLIEGKIYKMWERERVIYNIKEIL